MGAYSRGGLIKLFDKCHIKSSLSKLLFSILLQEQSKFSHYSLSKSSSLFGVGAYLRGGLLQFEVLAWGLIRGGAYSRGGLIRGFMVSNIHPHSTYLFSSNLYL